MSGAGFDSTDPFFGDAPLGDDAQQRRRARLRDIQDVAGELRRPVAAPDLTSAILARVEEERPFTTPRLRRLVWISRLAFAASISVAALGIALLHRSAPELVQWTHEARPVSDVVQTAKHEASATYMSLRGRLAGVPSLAGVGASADFRRVCAAAPAEPACLEPADHWTTLVADSRLAPLPPDYSATYVSLSCAARPAAEPAEPASRPVIVSTVQFVPGLAPRPLAAGLDLAPFYWGGRLSTAPAASTAVPVMIDGAALAPGARAVVPLDRLGIAHRPAPVAASSPRPPDWIAPASPGAGSGEFAVPR